MRLIWRVVLRVALALSLLLALWAGLFYYALMDEVNDEVDDSLEHYAQMLIRLRLRGEELPPAGFGTNGYRIEPVQTGEMPANPEARYEDREVYIPQEGETEPARVLTTLFRDAGGAWYRMTVYTPTIEKDDLREAILYWMVGLYGGLLLTVTLICGWVFYRSMRPLYRLLEWLDGYRVGAQNRPLASDTRIREFRRLNEAALRNAARAEAAFRQQKQFIGNASHEMQTPLAICRNRLELLAAGGLSEEQLHEVAATQRMLDYMVRLNRSLLFLSKIENGQFPESTTVDLDALVRRCLEELSEIHAGRRIAASVAEAGPLHAVMNESLAQSLISNLLRNAFVHTAPGGTIRVVLGSGLLRVFNSGERPLDGSRIFTRFYQGTRREGSTGLGLSIVDAICKHYGLGLEYRFVQGEHCFEVRFGAGG